MVMQSAGNGASNGIVSVDFDSVGIAVGLRSASLMRSRRPCVLGRPRACLVCLYPAPWQPRVGCAVCMKQVSAAVQVAARPSFFAAVVRAGVPGAVGSVQRGQWAGVRARQQGAAGAFSTPRPVGSCCDVATLI